MSEIDELMGKDHADIDQLLKSVFEMIRTRDAALVYTRLDLFWARLAVHIRAEHHQLFPELTNAARSTAGLKDEAAELESVMDGLRTDHDHFMKELAALVKIARSESVISLSELKVRLNALSDRLLAHNKIEESRIYPLAERLLSGSRSAALIRMLRNELENMPARFADSETN